MFSAFGAQTSTGAHSNHDFSDASPQEFGLSWIFNEYLLKDSALPHHAKIPRDAEENKGVIMFITTAE